jgi:hypothetical protein
MEWSLPRSLQNDFDLASSRNSRAQNYLYNKIDLLKELELIGNDWST